jgi:hypothetical protein
MNVAYEQTFTLQSTSYSKLVPFMGVTSLGSSVNGKTAMHKARTLQEKWG